MTAVKNFEEVKAVLSQHVPDQTQFKRAYNLKTMRALLAALDNPQEQYKVVHIAGTSGKTSTAYYMSALLQATGKKVGLTISPHIDEINERVQINLVPMEEAQFCKEFSVFIKLVNKLSINPSYFELFVAFAYWEFARVGVNYAVIETGLGGLLDGTNVVARADKVCILTDIGIDHAEILGETLSKIAAQKAGIIQEGNAIFTHKQSSEVMEVFKKQAHNKQAQLFVADEPRLSESYLPLFQQRNWALAKHAFDFVASRDALPSLAVDQVLATWHTAIPARMEIVQHGQKTIIIDGSHNAQKMATFVASFRAKFGTIKTAVLLAVVSDKRSELVPILEQLKPVATHLIITGFASQQDLRKTAIDPAIIKKHADALHIDSDIEINPRQAYKALLHRPEEILLITGSFYLLNHVRPLIFGAKND